MQTEKSINLMEVGGRRMATPMKKFKKNLKNEPGDLQAVYGLATCLIAKGNYDEARGFVDRLGLEMPDNKDVKELKKILKKH